MLPWEHVAVAYLAYSLLHRAALRRPPGDAVAVALVVGALLPDLIDKPLAWELGVLPGGRSLGHSLLLVLPATVAVWIVAEYVAGRASGSAADATSDRTADGTAERAAGRAVGIAFAVGALSHLATDVVYPTVFGREPVVSFLLYPLTDAPPSDAVGVVVRIREIWTDLAGFLATDRGRLYLAGEVALLGAATLLWLLDGAPGLRPRLVQRGARGDARGDR